MQPPAPSHPVPPAPYPPYPYGGYPSPYGQVYPASSGAGPYGYPPRRPVGLPRPTAVAPVPGTSFGVALVEVRPTASGPAVASLVAGIGSILVSTVVGLFAALGAQSGWGPAVAGAFAVLATLLCAAAGGLAGAAVRRIRASVAWGPTRGRGIAIAGVICGLAGFAVTALIMVISLASR